MTLIVVLFRGVLTKGDYEDPNVEDLKTMNLSRLSTHFAFNTDSVVTYFCGDSKDCRTLGSGTAPEKAKGKINNSLFVCIFSSFSLNILFRGT